MSISMNWLGRPKNLDSNLKIVDGAFREPGERMPGARSFLEDEKRSPVK